MNGLVQAGEVAIDFVAGWQMREGVGQDGCVFGLGEEFNGMKFLEQGRAELGGRCELRSPGSTVFFKRETVETLGEQRCGVGWEMNLAIFQEPGEDRAAGAGQDGGIGKEFELMVHEGLSDLFVKTVKTVEALNCIALGNAEKLKS
jgi:hypothetical protein